MMGDLREGTTTGNLRELQDEVHTSIHARTCEYICLHICECANMYVGKQQRYMDIYRRQPCISVYHNKLPNSAKDTGVWK